MTGIMRQLAWFILLWGFSVLSLGGIHMLIRWVLI